MKSQTVRQDIREGKHTFKGLKLWTFQSNYTEEPTIFKFIEYEIAPIAAFASVTP